MDIFVNHLFTWLRLIFQRLQAVTFSFAGHTYNLLGIMIGFLLISIITSVLWRGAKG